MRATVADVRNVPAGRQDFCGRAYICVGVFAAAALVSLMCALECGFCFENITHMRPWALSTR